jgi:molecular chaperone DnaK
MEGDPDRVVAFIKRYMGKDDYRQKVDGKEYLPEAISALILKKLVSDAETRLREENRLAYPLKRVIITVPAYFGQRERLATRQAGEMAGLEVVEIVNEPTAAAMSYFTEKDRPNETVLVYDLGGGTFDITLMKAVGPEMEELVVKGDDRRGGYDWDMKLAELVAHKFSASHPEAGELAKDEDWKRRNLDKAEECKKSLSSKKQAVFIVVRGDVMKRVEVSQEEFEAKTEVLLDETIHLVQVVLEEGKKREYDSPQKILLVGGSTKMPAVRRRLKELFSDQRVEVLVHDPDQAVAKGAAFLGFIRRIGEILEKSAGDFRLLVERFPNIGPFVEKGLPEPEPILSRSLGFQVVDEASGKPIVVHLLKQNDRLPVEGRDTFVTRVDNQDVVVLPVLEQNSETTSEDPKSNRKIAEVRITNLAPFKLPAKSPIEVLIRMNKDFRGVAIGREVKSGQEVPAELKVEGLSRQQITDAARWIDDMTNDAAQL